MNVGVGEPQFWLATQTELRTRSVPPGQLPMTKLMQAGIGVVCWQQRYGVGVKVGLPVEVFVGV